MGIMIHSVKNFVNAKIGDLVMFDTLNTIKKTSDDMFLFVDDELANEALKSAYMSKNCTIANSAYVSLMRQNMEALNSDEPHEKGTYFGNDIGGI